MVIFYHWNGSRVFILGKFARRKCQNCGVTFYEKKEVNDGKEVL